MSDDEQSGVDRALDAIHAGGHQLVALARSRVFGFMDELDKGDFRAALSEVVDLQNVVASLASAQGNMAIAEGSHLVKACDLEVDMELTDIGVITEKSMEPCGHVRCHGHVKIMVADSHELSFGGNAELFVRDAPTEDAPE